MNINPKTEQAYNLLHNGILAFARAERQGIRVDLDYIQRKKQHLTRKIQHLEHKFKQTKLYKHWTYINKNPNINSNAQLAHFLYKVKKLKPAYTTASGQGSTDEEALKMLNLPEMDLILEIRKLKKVRDTYLDAFEREQVKGYIHPFFNLHLVRTYRSSSDSPNFQNIPIRDEEAMQICRRALFPRPGHQLLEIDYSGLEFRIIACYSNDPVMIKYINNVASDIHGDTAKKLFKLSKFDKSNDADNNLRQAAKNGFVFPQLYGDYYKNCAFNIASKWIDLPQGKWQLNQGINNISNHLIENNIDSYIKFENYIEDCEKDFRSRFHYHWNWMNNWIKTYNKYGYIDLKTGFRCSDLMTKNKLINSPIQGSAFHCLLWSFIEIDKIMQKERWDSKLISQIHDSLIIDVNPKELNHVATIVKKITTEKLREAWDWIIAPLDVDMELADVDCSWAEKKGFEL